MKPTARLALQFSICLLVAIGLIPAAPTAAQKPSNGRDSDSHRRESEADLETRVWNLRALSELPHPAAKKRPNPQQRLAEMQKDFTRLQIVNVDLLRLALGKNALDPKFVLKSVTEIRERAERLNKNLALPEIDKTAEPSRTVVPDGPDHLKRSVLRLGTLIFSFVDNPFFREIAVVDTQQTARARRDLEDILELTAEIKKQSGQKE